MLVTAAHKVCYIQHEAGQDIALYNTCPHCRHVERSVAVSLHMIPTRKPQELNLTVGRMVIGYYSMLVRNKQRITINCCIQKPGHMHACSNTLSCTKILQRPD